MLLGTQEVGGDGVLRVGGCSTLDLAEEHGTPVYLYDEAEIRRMCRAYVDGFEARWPHVDVSYACKAFTAPAMMELALSEGLGLEVVSVGEMNMALHCGCPPELLTYHGTFKTEPDLEFAIDADCGVIVIDNLTEIAAIARTAERLGKVQPVLVRINPTVTGLENVQYTTVGDDTKFGLSIEHGFAPATVVTRRGYSLERGLFAAPRLLAGRAPPLSAKLRSLRMVPSARRGFSRKGFVCG